MKKPARRRTTPAVSTANQADAEIRALWMRRSHALLLGFAVALIVATPLIPSEAAIAFGSHVILIMAWLLLTAGWLVRCLFERKPVWHVGPTGALLGLFLAVHSLSAVIMMHQGHGRPTLNALWLWGSLGLMFLTVRQLVRNGVEQRALVSVVMAVAVALSLFGIYQVIYVYPRLRAEYQANPERILREAGEIAPPGSPQRRHFEDRLASKEPTGPFALTNSLAGVLAPCLILVVGLSVPIWRSSAGKSWAISLGLLTIAGIILTCLLLTKSRSGCLATLVGLSFLALWKAVPRTWLRWRQLGAGLAGVLVIGAGVTLFGGLDRQVLTEAFKSLLYRFEYWRASAALVKDYPIWGCGPGNFKDYYTHYKLPEASETISDPHNFLVEVAATAGLPALGLFVLVWLALVWQVWRCRDRGTDIGHNHSDSADPKPIYMGAGFGVLLAYPAGLAGGQPLVLDMLWVVLPTMLLSLWLLHRWVVRGNLPVGPLLIAVATLFVNLLAAGGIGFPGVAGLLWVLGALALNAAESTLEPATSAPSPGWWSRAVVSRWMIRLATVGTLTFILLGYVTMYRPVLAGHEFTTRMAGSTSPGYTARQVAQASRAAAAADRWWADPCQMWADACHHLWIVQPTDVALAEFDEAILTAQSRNPQSSGLARQHGTWLIEMYLASGRDDMLERSVIAYARAVELYPNSNVLHAQLAWTCYCAGQLQRAGLEAERALQLDEQMPHRELKLRNQVLSGRVPRKEGGGSGSLTGGGDPEQLMRDIRKRSSAR